MIGALIFMVILGAGCGLILSVASKIFYVYEDPRIAAVESAMAGANCGGCGYAGCSAAAVAVVAGVAPPSVCIVGGPECAKNVAAVMGMDAGSAQVPISENECQGGFRADDHYHYLGVNSCRAMAVFYGGKRVC
ncbi:MAG: electron transporter RnfB, partial [Desulfobacteraceae bacterium]|nr:electron transporter RnfB [Desulfobacteraceae bacterium]